MAGERKGKTYEAIVSIVLENLKKAGKIKSDIFWNKKPDWMTIEPDFTIGKNYNSPEYAILITHGGSAKESNRKYWRNTGELVELKLGPVPQIKVYSVIFDAVIKAGILKLEENTLDNLLVVSNRPYGNAIQKWVDQNQAGLPTQASDKVAEIQTRLKTDKVLPPFIALLQTDIERLLKKKTSKLASLWTLERARSKGKAPKARDTFVRRGLSKFLIFEDRKLGLSLYRGHKVSVKSVPDYVFRHGLAVKTIAQAKPGDPEIQNVVNLLTDAQIHATLMSVPLAKVEPWLLTLRNIQHLVTMGDYALKEYTNLCDPKILAQRLLDLHKNPTALITAGSAPMNWPPGTVWLVEYLIELVKVASGSANGFGYAQMAREIYGRGGYPNPANRVYTIVLSDWIRRIDAEKMPIKILLGITCVLSGHLKKIGKLKIKQIVQALPGKISSNLIESKLCTYRGMEPLFDLIAHSLTNYNRSNIRACFAEAAGMKGQSGKTAVIQSGSTLINWQSCHGSHTNDKKKELGGRAVALRYSWDAATKQFIPRPGVKKLILVVDGTWRQSDLDALVRAGWDEIFYPDEMAKLKKSVI
jgi:hypothetical protein